MPRPVPTGEENFNSRFDGGATLLHTNVKQLKYDIVDLVLIYGADANIIENEKQWRILWLKTTTHCYSKFYTVTKQTFCYGTRMVKPG